MSSSWRFANRPPAPLPRERVSRVETERRGPDEDVLRTCPRDCGEGGFDGIIAPASLIEWSRGQVGRQGPGTSRADRGP